MDRGPARAFDRRQSLAPAIAQDPRRGRQRGRHPRHRRRVFPRPGRLRAHARNPRRAHDGRYFAGSLPGAGLSFGRPFPPHQQDAGRDLPRARPLRDDLRARAAGGRYRRQARDRPHRSAPAQRHHHRGTALRTAARSAGRTHLHGYRRLYRAARQADRQDRLEKTQRRSAKAQGGRRTCRHRRRHVRGKERAWSG